MAADLDGDGEDEYVVRFTRELDPGRGHPDWLTGSIIIFDRDGGTYAPTFRLAEEGGDIGDFRYLNPTIFAIEDVNGDGRLEAVLTVTNCGAHTCSLILYLLAFRAGHYVSIVESSRGSIGAFFAPQTEDQLRFVDVDGDGIKEIVFRQGVINSVGAGPQREATLTYRWDGEMYTYWQIEYDPSDLRYFKVRDGDDAFAVGDYQRAIARYREAIDNPGLQEVQYFGNREDLLAYSEFRIGLAYLKLGQITLGSQAINAVTVKYPDSLHGKAAVVFRDATDWTQAGMTGDLSAGCQAVTSFAQENLERFREAWYYGYANPEFHPEALCPF